MSEQSTFSRHACSVVQMLRALFLKAQSHAITSPWFFVLPQRYPGRYCSRATSLSRSKMLVFARPSPFAIPSMAMISWCVCMCVCGCLPACLLVCLTVCLSVRPSVCLFVCLSACLPAYLCMNSCSLPLIIVALLFFVLVLMQLTCWPPSASSHATRQVCPCWPFVLPPISFLDPFFDLPLISLPSFPCPHSFALPLPPPLLTPTCNQISRRLATKQSAISFCAGMFAGIALTSVAVAVFVRRQ